ncbi:glycosyltransferase family 2 protein [Flagellimonas oceanensis]|uniref:glycosyltransferase family 2 protein n=1 Tax=Flagellimonas oceanensis TaxID=2499163 RepID=UPI000F8E8877|nr:glycosyltransferase [Allomuricauda oceanensis]
MNYSTPLVTVYITNYNYEKYIENAIESVLGQTMQNFELIIIDDGSKDNSRDIIERYSEHPKISIIYQQNKGLNITNNVALRASKGKYIVRLDADDYFTEDALEKMSSILEENDTLGLVFPDYFIVDSENNVVSEIRRHDFENEVTILDQPAHGACTMIRVEYMKSVGGYDESYTCQDGYELWVKFISKFKVTNIKETLFYYRRHNANLTNNEDRILSTRFKIKEAFVENESLNLPKVMAIVPIRLGYNLAMERLNGTTFLDYKIQSLLESKKIDLVVVVSSDKTIKKHVDSMYGDSVCFYDRPSKLERINVSLFQTLLMLSKEPRLASMDCAMFCSLNYPFVSEETINDAVNTLTIFKADSLISVRPENNKFFRHTGQGMQAILQQDKFTKLERESLYKYSGGILLGNIKSALAAGKIVHGDVGHIVISEKASLNAESSFEKGICRLLMEKNEIEAKS